MDTQLCTYCVNLPILDRDRRGARSRCPLCKSETLRTSSGATYRCPAEAMQACARRRWPLTAAVVVVGLTAVVVILMPRRAPAPSEVVRNGAIAPGVELVDAGPAAFKPGTAQTFVGFAKPTAHPPESASKPYASPPPPPPPEPELLPLPLRAVRVDFWTSPHLSGDTLLQQVSKFPEVGLTGNDEAYDRTAAFKLATALATQDLKTGGPLVDHIKKRNDISSLPFLFGKSELDPKAVKALAMHSAEITRLLDGRFDLERRPVKGPRQPTEPTTQPAPVDENRSEDEKVTVFWAHYGFPRQVGALALPDGTAALEQVLMAKSPQFRQSLVDVMAHVDGPASKILVRRALFDLDPAVRRAAVAALERRNEHEYTDLLIDGFRYPWPPVARHAAEALIALDRTDLVDSLLALLGERDPYTATVGGTPVAREMVRINHFKNCLLCHPPIPARDAQKWLAQALEGDAAVPVGVVPIPGEKMPKGYVDEMRAGIFVRADVSHLRQDFSVRLDVMNMDPWPISQRFDIVVRNRPLGDEESIRRYGSTLRASPNGASLLFAIEQLQARPAPPPAPVLSSVPKHLLPPKPPVSPPAEPSSDNPHLIHLARAVPEVSLWHGQMDGDKLRNLSQSIHSKNTPKDDVFIAELRRTRDDLAGLPFAMGDACRIPKAAAKALATNSIALNTVVSRERRRAEVGAVPNKDSVDAFWEFYQRVWSDADKEFAPSPTAKSEAVPAVEQVLSGMSPLYRGKLVEVVSKSPDAASVFVRRALYDFDPEVRRLALLALEKDNNNDGAAKLLMNGFRYPWPPVARHAAEALVALKRTDLVDKLEAMRGEPDPYLAGEGAEQGDGRRPMIREVVRVNHLKNCFLCHPPLPKEEGLQLLQNVGPKMELPFGVVPVPGQAIPVRYYNDSSADIFVRVDATYLRQDFSVMLDVPGAKPWPASQRFDFLVRTRPRTAAEIENGPRLTTLERSANGPALLAAIERLREP